MIMKNSTNFYSKVVARIKLQYKMDMVLQTVKMVVQPQRSQEGLKKKQEKYRDTSQLQLMKRSSRTTSQILLKERNLIGSAKNSKCAKCKILLASH
jgi:hypothetical protein